MITVSSRQIRSALVAVVALALPWIAQASPASAATNDPVIVVAGTFSPSFANQLIAQRLRNQGFDVTVFQLPTLGTQSITTTAKSLGPIVDQVRARTGASRVDLVGHSQGGLVARDYVKNNGGAAKVDKIVTLGTPHYGTALANLATLVTFGTCVNLQGCKDMQQGSTYLNNLNAGSDVISPTKIVSIRTQQDEVVFPISNSVVKDGATNIRLQDKCPLRVVDHLTLITDGAVASGVISALKNQTISFNCFAI
jgi:triacylglycerol esterase/lipase EstA (alpha/beta hydrolase family)